MQHILFVVVTMLCLCYFRFKYYSPISKAFVVFFCLEFLFFVFFKKREITLVFVQIYRSLHVRDINLVLALRFHLIQTVSVPTAAGQ